MSVCVGVVAVLVERVLGSVHRMRANVGDGCSAMLD